MAEPTPEEMQQALAAAQATESTPQTIRIETKTGQVFEGATDQEVLQKLVQSVESGSTHIRSLNERIDSLEQQRQMPVQQQPTGQKSPQDLYWEKWQKDPIEADRFAASQRLGLPMEMVDQVERQTIQNAAALSQNTAISEFLNRCPDYPNDDPNAAMMMKQQLARQFPGQQPSADTMELAFNALVRNGSVVPREIGIEGYGDTQDTIPRVGSSQQIPPVDFELQFRQLAPDKQKQVIEQLFAQGAR